MKATGSYGMSGRGYFKVALVFLMIWGHSLGFAREFQEFKVKVKDWQPKKTVKARRAVKLKAVKARSVSPVIQAPRINYRVEYRVRKAAPTTRKIAPKKRKSKTVFNTINKALNAASTDKALSVKVLIEKGTYAEDIVITRATNLTARSGHKVTIAGRINNDKGHSLSLEGIDIRGARGYGLRQKKGNLTLKNVGVYDTRRTRKGRDSGKGMELSNGARGFFTDVVWGNNANTALYIHGSGTKVVASRVLVKDTRIHQQAIDARERQGALCGAVDVCDEATLLLENFEITRNDMAGIMVQKGGKAHVRRGEVTSSKSRSTGQWSSTGGNNIIVLSGGKLELNNFQTHQAESCGLRMHDSWLKARNGRVHHNAIGLGTTGTPDENYDVYDHVVDGMHFHDNGTNLSTDYLPVPDPGLGEEEEPQIWEGVPWE